VCVTVRRAVSADVLSVISDSLIISYRVRTLNPCVPEFRVANLPAV
jgi:hypothetical protein